MNELMRTMHKAAVSTLVSLRKQFFQSNALKKVRIGDFDMYINGTHALPRYLKNNPHYSANLPRLAAHLKNSYPDLRLIDIGANVGDTLALVKTKCDIPIVSIEGDAEYFSILQKNKDLFKNVDIYKLLLDEKVHVSNTEIKSGDGTAHVSATDTSFLEFTTLDTFLNHHSQFKKSKLLKIDTDGYDLKIIRGGMNYIKTTKPVVFFEFDRFFLSKIGDNGISTLSSLRDAGYSTIVFYDNSGRLLISLSLQEISIIQQLYQYTYKKKGAFPYYDVVVFHELDKKSAESFIAKEIALQNENIV